MLLRHNHALFDTHYTATASPSSSSALPSSLSPGLIPPANDAILRSMYGGSAVAQGKADEFKAWPQYGLSRQLKPSPHYTPAEAPSLKRGASKENSQDEALMSHGALAKPAAPPITKHSHTLQTKISSPQAPRG